MNNNLKNNMKIVIFNISQNGANNHLQDYVNCLYTLTLDDTINDDIKKEIKNIYDRLIKAIKNGQKSNPIGFTAADQEILVKDINKISNIVNS